MVDSAITNSVRKYLDELISQGIPIQYAILFGSYARDTDTHNWSDIDLLIVSSLYDGSYTREHINLLWRTAARIDSRIEPIPVGLNRWRTDDESTIIEVARREGIQIRV